MQTTLHADKAGQLAPINDEGIGACDADPSKPHDNQQCNSASDGGDGKAYATLQAHFALAGLQLHRLDDGTLLMSRWGLTRVFDDDAAAKRFIAALGVGHG